MSTSEENDDRVWRACLAEPDWQAELRENDRVVTNALIAEKERQQDDAEYFNHRLTIEDHVFLHGVKIDPLE